MHKKFVTAQASLLARASVLQLCGVAENVFTNCHPTIGVLTFSFGEVDLRFDDENPYNEQAVDEVIKQLDEMIEQEAKKAEHTIEVIKAWRG